MSAQVVVYSVHMENVPIGEANLSLLFDPANPQEHERLRNDLLVVAEGLRSLGEHFHARAGWTGAGLEMGILSSGQVELSGFVEPDDVSFLLELRPPGYFGEGSCATWEIEGVVSVRCDSAIDCGMHELEVRREPATTPADAVHALLKMSEWLCGLAKSRPLESWREADTRSLHP